MKGAYMAEETKPQLTEEEQIERKAKLFRTISRILTVVAVIVIGVFIYFAMGTRDNISRQTEIDTQALRSKLKQIVSLEKRYHQENGEYAGFKFNQLCKEITRYDPELEGLFMFSFDAETGIATGRERDASHDANDDIDGNDGLTLSAEWEGGVLDGGAGGNFFWPESDLQDFEQRIAEGR
jgi:hypothetical protein